MMQSEMHLYNGIYPGSGINEIRKECRQNESILSALLFDCNGSAVTCMVYG